jgi:hypothetical protein
MLEDLDMLEPRESPMQVELDEMDRSEDSSSQEGIEDAEYDEDISERNGDMRGSPSSTPNRD